MAVALAGNNSDASESQSQSAGSNNSADDNTAAVDRALEEDGDYLASDWIGDAGPDSGDDSTPEAIDAVLGEESWIAGV